MRYIFGIAILAIALTFTSSVEAATVGEPFGMAPTEYTGNDPEAAQWNNVMREETTDRAIADLCRADSEQCTAPIRRLLKLITFAEGHPGEGSLGLINREGNLAFKWELDEKLYPEGQARVSSLVTLEKGAGDCKDKALVKSLMLQAAGIPAERMRIVRLAHRNVYEVVDGVRRHMIHVVLAVYSSKTGAWLLLDEPRLTMTPDTQATYYMPLQVFRVPRFQQPFPASAVSAIGPE